MNSTSQKFFLIESWGELDGIKVYT